MLQSSETSMICVLGVAGVKGSIELYGVNCARKVTIHGWFAQGMGLSVLSERPPCLIAVDTGALPPETIAALQDKGHRVVVMPGAAPASIDRTPTEEALRTANRRTAKEICNLAIRLAECTPSLSARELN